MQPFLSRKLHFMMSKSNACIVVGGDDVCKGGVQSTIVSVQSYLHPVYKRYVECDGFPPVPWWIFVSNRQFTNLNDPAGAPRRRVMPLKAFKKL